MSLEEFFNLLVEHKDTYFVTIHYKELNEEEYHQKIKEIPLSKIGWYCKDSFLKNYHIDKYEMKYKFDIDIDSFYTIFEIYTTNYGNIYNYIGTPVYKVDENLYLLTWNDDKCSGLEEVHDEAKNIREELPPGAQLIVLPDVYNLTKINVDDLETIRDFLNKQIERFKNND